MSDVRVPVAELRRHVGTRRPVRRSVTLVLPEIAGTAVPPDREIELDLVLESVLDGVVAEGHIVAPWRGACRRCLEPVEGELDVAVRELFEASPVAGETYPIEGDHIDLEPLVRDAVLLALPLSPLCRDACEGPDPERFPARPERDAAAADPRWAALRDVRFED